jgi:mono/diheme cytochrome c family protein
MSRYVAASALFAALIFSAIVLAQAPSGGGVAQSGAPAAGQGGRGGLVAYPPRPPGDPAAIERGNTLFALNCRFCHGSDARGGDGGGPNLLRSSTVLDDQKGELIAAVVQKGRGAMASLPLTMEQIQDIAAFLHSIPVSSRTGPATLNILVGDVKKGEAYVAQTCARCHTPAALQTFADKLDDSEDAPTDVDDARQRGTRVRAQHCAHSTPADYRAGDDALRRTCGRTGGLH